jgi:hypothetical protein
MPSKNEDILQKLAPSIVEIISDQDSTTLGTGFVVADDGLIVTCRHVITGPQNNLMQSVKVRFHSDSKADAKKFAASLIIEDQNFKDDPSIDIAFLKLDKLPEKGVTPVKLDDKIVSLNHFASIGFKKAEEFTGLSAKGEIRILTHIENSNSNLQSPALIELYSPNQIEPGMSGAPVLDLERNRVVGIITERYKEEYSPGISHMAFALPVKAMIDLCPILEKQNPGLQKIFKFLMFSGFDEDKIWNSRIDDLYVPPRELDKIKATLEKRKIVFIVGTKEYGKTYTAMKLLWEYFCDKGYMPKYIKEDEKDRIKDLEKELEPNHIIYLEDPFGKERYVKDDNLEYSISNMIQNIEGYDNVYMVITSREDIRKEFHPLGGTDTGAIEVKLGLENGSYDLGRRQTMLLKWAKATNCKWLRDESIKNTILRYFENEEKLPTPLSIKDFVIDRTVKNSTDKDFLLKKIDFHSRATADRFAQEIWFMSTDRILFLAFPLILSTFDIKFIEKKYQELIQWLKNDLNIKVIADFWDALDWFRHDKINVLNNDEISFSHPSYLGSIDYVLSHPYSNIPESNIPKKIVSKVLTEVSRDPLILDALFVNSGEKSLRFRYPSFYRFIELIVKHYNELPQNTKDVLKDLLIQMSKNERTAFGVSYYLMRTDVPRFPDDIRNRLLEILCKEHPFTIANYVEKGFDQLSNDIRNELLEILSSDYRVADYAARIIIKNIDKLTMEIIRDLLMKMASMDRVTPALGVSIGWDIEKLPLELRDEFLETLAEKRGGAIFRLVDGIIEHYYKNPAYRRELLIMMASNIRMCNPVGNTLLFHYKDIPMDVGSKLLEILADTEESALAATIIISHYNELPPGIRNLLFEIVGNLDEPMRKFLKGDVNRDFDKLPLHVREKLLNALSNNS